MPHKNNPPGPRQKKWPEDESGPLKRRRKRPRQRNFGIEIYRCAWAFIKRKAGWYIWDWYTLESQRDMALENLNKKLKAHAVSYIPPATKYRKINRNENEA